MNAEEIFDNMSQEERLTLLERLIRGEANEGTDADQILERLEQEERSELLEHLMQGAARAQQENVPLEERVERLESLIGAGMKGGARREVRVIRRHMHHGAGHIDMTCECC